MKAGWRQLQFKFRIEELRRKFYWLCIINSQAVVATKQVPAVSAATTKQVIPAVSAATTKQVVPAVSAATTKQVVPAVSTTS